MKTVYLFETRGSERQSIDDDADLNERRFVVAVTCPSCRADNTMLTRRCQSDGGDRLHCWRRNTVTPSAQQTALMTTCSASSSGRSSHWSVVWTSAQAAAAAGHESPRLVNCCSEARRSVIIVWGRDEGNGRGCWTLQWRFTSDRINEKNAQRDVNTARWL